MSTEKSANRLLIVEGEALLGQTLRRHFEEQGYAAETAVSGEEGIALAQTSRPHLILLAVNLSDMPGLDVFRTLRSKPRTGHIPVMFMADDTSLQNQVLEEGAYDFLEKPLDLDILVLRVRNALRRAEREGLTEPRTGLPTGRLLDERIQALEKQSGWYRIDVQIAEYGVFRDIYGFVTANEALRFAGNLIAEIVNELGTPDDFVGHRSGTEEFVIITTQSTGLRLRERLSQRVSEELKSFYNFMEREQGFVLLEDGTGGHTHKPLMSAQVQVTQPQASGGADDPWVDVVEPEEKQTPDDSPDSTTSSGSAFDW